MPEFDEMVRGLAYALGVGGVDAVKVRAGDVAADGDSDGAAAERLEDGGVCVRFFTPPRELRFDGVATACVFAWEERARESAALMLDRIRKELAA